MKQRNKSFKNYVRQMGEAEGHESKPGWFERTFGGTEQKRDSSEQRLFKTANSLARVLNFPIGKEEIQKGIRGSYRELDAGKQSFMMVARSIFNSITGGNPVGINRGQMQVLLRALGSQAQRYLGDEANSIEALALFIGQEAQRLGGHITLEPRFQKDVQTYYDEKHDESKKDRIRKNEIRRGGLEYLGDQIKSMGLSEETVNDLRKAINWVIEQASERKTTPSRIDISKLELLLKGMGGAP